MVREMAERAAKARRARGLEASNAKAEKRGRALEY
jgi:hypothetical protein